MLASGDEISMWQSLRRTIITTTIIILIKIVQLDPHPPTLGHSMGLDWGNGKYKTKKNQKIKRKITLLCKVSKSARFSIIAPGLHFIRNFLREPLNHIAVELSILLLNQAIVFVFSRVLLPD